MIKLIEDRADMYVKTSMCHFFMPLTPHVCRNRLSRPTTRFAHSYLYGASARAAAAISGSHLSPFANNFSLLYSSSSRVSVAYSALGAVFQVSPDILLLKEMPLKAYIQLLHLLDSFPGRSRNRYIWSCLYHNVLFSGYHPLALRLQW